MKHLKNFHTFNEGLFSDYNNDEDIAASIAFKLANQNYIVKPSLNGYLIENIKLDNNPGTYNIIYKDGKIMIEYYKFTVLIFKKELDCTEETTSLILGEIKKAESRGNS